MDIAASITPNRTRFGPLLFAGEVERGLSSLAELGYQGVELSLRTKDDLDRRAFGEALRARGLRLFAIATGQSCIEDGFSFFSRDDDARAGAIARIKDHVDFASEWDARVILGGIRGRLDDIDDGATREKGYRAIEACVDYAAGKRVILLLEAINRYETNVFNTVEETARFLADRPSPYLRILPDTFHMNIEEADMGKALESNKELIGALHCADSNRRAPGLGHIDFSRVVRTVKDLPSLGYLGVEALPLPDSSTCAKVSIATIREAARPRQPETGESA